MVRVLRCHHFASQDVFTTDNEPHAMHVAAGMAFVATDQCYIEVHSLIENGCPRIFHFPTVAPVKQLVYSKPDDFIATLEEKPTIAGSQSTVRVYIHWRSDLSQQPMRASIAGHMTSLRHNDEDSNRFEVIEIPLKGNPRCICIDPTFGTLGIGIGTSLLVYGFCIKTVAETKVRHREVKCLLQLEFKFKVRQVALCEDYLACSSNSEVQVVKLKDPICPGPDVGECPAVSKTARNVTTGADQGPGPPVDVSAADTVASDLPVFTNQEPHSPVPTNDGSASMLQVPASTDGCHELPGNSVLHEQDDSVVRQNRENPQSATSDGNPPVKSLKAIRKIMLRGLATVKGKPSMADVRLENGVVLGPVDNPNMCPVSVEYENVCNPDCNKRNHVLNGVMTCLYRRFGSSSSLHSLQLIPVYLHVGHTRAEERGKRCGMFCPVSNHGSLVGMSVFISDEKSGCLYSVHGQSQALATYPYTNTAKQVSVGEQLLYVVTKSGLEIYTSRCLAAALHSISPVDNVTNALPAADMEPCLVGIHPFIGARSVAATSGRILLLSKCASSGSDLEEVNWSLYSLQCDRVCSLYKDMMELAEQHQSTNPLSWLHLVKEGHVLLRGHQFKHGSNNAAIHQLICQSAASLTEQFMRAESEDWKLALPYALISGLSIGEVVQRALRHGCEPQSSSESEGSLKGDALGRGLRLYLNYMLFRQENPILASQCEGDLVLTVYAVLDPSMLSTVILHSTLNSYSNDKALKLLQEKMESPAADLPSDSRSVLDVLCVTALQLRLGRQDEAEATLLSMPEKDVFKTYTAQPWLLHDNLSRLSQTAEVLRQHKRKLFTEIVVALVQQRSLQLDVVNKLLQGRSNGPVHMNGEIREVLEGILADDNYKHFFKEAGLRLIDLYLDSLDDWKPSDNTVTLPVTICDVIPKGNGHFMKRFRWLDHLPPFTGASSLLAPCTTKKSGDPSTPQTGTPLSTTPQISDPQPNHPQPSSPQSDNPHIIHPQSSHPEHRSPQSDHPQSDHPQLSHPQPSTGTTEPNYPQLCHPQPSTAEPNHPQLSHPQSKHPRPSPQNDWGSDRPAHCTCCRCNAELLKLQSLLCSRHMCRESVQHVLSRVEPSSRVHGRDALRALSLCRVNTAEAVTMVTDHYLHVLTMFTSEMLGTDNNLWSHVVSRMVTKLKSSPSGNDGSSQPELVETFKRVLTHMTEVLPPGDLIPLLPPDGSVKFFLPFIERSQEKHQAQKLEDLGPGKQRDSPLISPLCSNRHFSDVPTH